MMRKPIVAGKFYPASEGAIKKMLSSFAKEDTTKEDTIVAVMPHAGYIYSGQVALQTASSIEIKENIILLGPNHTGAGYRFSIASQTKWQTPLGEVNVNSEIAEGLKKECSLIKENDNAHMYEHSLEVQIPILQFLSKKTFSIVPLILMPAKKSDYENIAQAIYGTITDLKIREKTLIIASSDMTHYESSDSAKKKDNLAIEAILKLDEDMLLERIKKYDISMCGYVPVTIAIMASKKLGAKKARLIKYQNSGETSGDYDSVVGYAGITIS